MISIILKFSKKRFNLIMQNEASYIRILIIKQLWVEHKSTKCWCSELPTLPEFNDLDKHIK